jgi:glyoxylase-like metal-dependent hydrolase (beta-lactamase superfamily II)
MLLDSLVNKLFLLPDDVKAYSGHGQSTVIGDEKVKNPAARYQA